VTNLPSLDLKLTTQSGKSNALLYPMLRSVNEKAAELLCLRLALKYSVVSNQPSDITSDYV